MKKLTSNSTHKKSKTVKSMTENMSSRTSRVLKNTNQLKLSQPMFQSKEKLIRNPLKEIAISDRYNISMMTDDNIKLAN